MGERKSVLCSRRRFTPAQVSVAVISLFNSFSLLSISTSHPLLSTIKTSSNHSATDFIISKAQRNFVFVISYRKEFVFLHTHASRKCCMQDGISRWHIHRHVIASNVCIYKNQSIDCVVTWVEIRVQSDSCDGWFVNFHWIWLYCKPSIIVQHGIVVRRIIPIYNKRTRAIWEFKKNVSISTGTIWMRNADW